MTGAYNPRGDQAREGGAFVRVALFATCLLDQFFAGAGVATVKLLRSLGVEVAFPRDQTCCGQPASNAGHWEEARTMARHTMAVFEGYDYVVLPSGSCGSMLRTHYPELFVGLGADYLRAVDLAERTYELSGFIVRVLGVERLGEGLKGRRLAYHHGCHALRELGLEDEPVRLLRGAGAELLAWEADTECCGFGGVFSVKVPHVSAAMADRKLDTLPEVDALVSTDAGCLLHLAGLMRRRVEAVPARHLAELLWEAHGEA